MSWKIRIALISAVTMAAAVAIVVCWGMWAIRQVEPFYAAALKVDREILETSGHALESRVADLVSTSTGQTDWKAVFSDDEVNGWLATDFVEKFPDILSDEVELPRVAFLKDELSIGFQYRGEDFSSTITVTVRLDLLSDDRLAIEFVSARAGALPIPMKNIIEPVAVSAREMGLPLGWTQNDGRAVAVISISDLISTDGVRRSLETIELHEGEIYLAGTSREGVARFTHQTRGTVSH